MTTELPQWVELQTMRNLLKEIAARCPGGVLPDTYCVWDCETSGLDPFENRIIQLGLAFVDGRKVMDSFAQCIRRPPSCVLTPGAVAKHGITRERLDAEGVPAEEFMPEIIKNMMDWQASGKMFAGHNLGAFDVLFLENEAKEYGLPLKFQDNMIIDTGMLVKATQLGITFRGAGETLRGFYTRLREIRAKGVFWALDKHCYATYNLGKYGINKDAAHDAGVDCLLVHYLFEELRHLAGGAADGG